MVVEEIRLAQGGALTGRLEDADGRPLDGVHVQITRFDADGAPRVVRSDPSGVFHARHLRPGTYRVRVDADTVSGGPRVEAVAEVLADRTTTVTFVAGDAGIIAGTVTREGRAVAGALVDLIHQPAAAAEALRRHRAVTDIDGRFEVGGLAAGAYEVVLQSGAFRALQHLVLEPDHRLDVDLEVWPGVLRGRVLTRSGRAVPGAAVGARPMGADGRPLAAPGFIAEGRTDPTGHFQLRGLPLGTYSVTVSAVGLPPGRHEGAEADLPGAAFDVEIVLGRGGDLNLQVRDQEERGVTGARVWLEDDQGAELNRQPYITGAGGRLRIDGVPAGTIQVRVHARGLGRPGLQRVAIEEGRQTDLGIVLRPAGMLHLRVGADQGDPAFRTRIDILRSGTGELVASRRPLAPSRQSSRWGYVPGTGELVVEDLEPGSYVARISAGRSFEPVDVGVQVQSGEVAHLHVTLHGR